MVKFPTLDGRRKRRLLTEEEAALWQTVASTAKPLRRAKPASKSAAAPLPPPAEIAKPSPAPKPAKSAPPRLAPLKPPPPPKPPPLSPLTRREKSRIARGQREIDARIDLHGLTQARAHRALLAFLHRSAGEGAAVVLVITGKGSSFGPDSERGILRRQVPQWLGLPELRSLVLGFETAHIGHGGEGALYVRLRRLRS